MLPSQDGNNSIGVSGCYKEVDDMIQYYLNRIRQDIVPATGSEDYLFLTRSGHRCTNASGLHWELHHLFPHCQSYIESLSQLKQDGT